MKQKFEETFDEKPQCANLLVKINDCWYWIDTKESDIEYQEVIDLNDQTE